MSNQNLNSTYITQLDTLRAIAVILVLISHWISPYRLINYFPNGMMGVNLFFVLSGFLITGILINTKKSSESSNQSKFIAIKNFFIRRALRIFPIYFILIIILYFIRIELIYQNPLSFFTYTQNFLFHSFTSWPNHISHLWTLAVEEQFYLIWPFIILFTPQKYFIKIMIALILFGLTAHLTLDILLYTNKLNSVLLPSTLYSFGLGGLLSALYTENSLVLKTRNSKYILLATLCLYLLYILNIINFYSEIFERFLFSILSFYIIHFAYNMKGVLLDIFNNRITTYLGKISYGIYLFHPIMYLIYVRLHLIFKKHNIKIPFTDIILFSNEYPLMRLFALTILVIIVSTLSWYLIEKPINKLKSKFI